MSEFRSGFRFRSAAALALRRAVAVLALLASACTTAGLPLDAPSRALRERLAAGDFAAADALIGAGAPRLDERTALDLALRDGLPDAVRHYLERVGADTPLGVEQATPLIRAVRDAPPAARATLVALLLQAGANPERTDLYGQDARDWARRVHRDDLLAALDGRDVVRGDGRSAALVRWLAASPSSAPVPTPSIAPRSAVPAGVDGGAPAATPIVTPIRRAGIERGVPRRPEPLSPSLLLRGSPWSPDVSDGSIDGPLAALRFHADGLADVLARSPGPTAVASPLTGSAAAWRLDAGTIRLAIVGEALSAACVGRAMPEAGAAVAGSALPVLQLACEAAAVPYALRRAPPQEAAEAVLAAFDLPPAPPTLAAIAAGRAALPGSDGDEAGRAGIGPLSPAPRLTVRLRADGPRGACPAPSPLRFRAPRPAADVRGDWYAVDPDRALARAPTSGRLCRQADARDAAMAACRAATPGGASCRGVGGCPAGQVSAVAGLPGVPGGWVGCDAEPQHARRAALAACRAAIGCDCQLFAISGRNLAPVACPPPRSAGPRSARSAASGRAAVRPADR